MIGEESMDIAAKTIMILHYIDADNELYSYFLNGVEFIFRG